MMKTLYLIGVEGGVEPFTWWPFQNEEDRDEAAKAIHKRQRIYDSLFWADVDEGGGLVVGSYIAGFFWDEWLGGPFF